MFARLSKNEMIRILNNDLANEWIHLEFYLCSGSLVTGLHREEFKEFFQKQAANEMAHVTAFMDLIIGLGGEPTKIGHCNSFPTFRNITEILKYALIMEEEVVNNYTRRIKDIEDSDLSPADAKWLEIFLEGQIQDSREDVDHIRQMLL